VLPAQDGIRGDTEAAFYQKVWGSNPRDAPRNQIRFQAGALSSSPPTADAVLGPQPAQLAQERGANGADVAVGADVANGADVAVLRGFIPKFCKAPSLSGVFPRGPCLGGCGERVLQLCVENCEGSAQERGWVWRTWIALCVR
jgi:hypothetical protein